MIKKNSERNFWVTTIMPMYTTNNISIIKIGSIVCGGWIKINNTVFMGVVVKQNIHIMDIKYNNFLPVCVLDAIPQHKTGNQNTKIREIVDNANFVF